MIRTWDVQSEQLKKEFSFPVPFPVSLLGIGHSSWGQRVATGFDGRIEFWDTETASKTNETVPVPGRNNMVIAFSFDGKRVAVGSEDVLTLHDNASGRELRRFTSHGHRRIAISPDGTQLMASGSNGPVTIWDVESAQPLITLDGTALDWSPDNQRIAVGTPDGLQIWKLPRSRIFIVGDLRE